MSQYVKLLTLLLQGAVIANYEYWSEFILRIQRDEARRPQAFQDWFGAKRIPSLLCLRLRGRWRIGEQQKWEMAIQQFPMKGVIPMPEEAPLQASSLVMMLGIEILTVSFDQNSELTLVLADGRILTVEGINEEWEERNFGVRWAWTVISGRNGMLPFRLVGNTYCFPIFLGSRYSLARTKEI